MSRRRTSLGAWALVAAVGLALPLAACFGPEYHSVRFNTARPDFFRMPQTWRGLPSEKRARDTPSETEGYESPDPDVRRMHLQDRARSLEKAGQFHEAAVTWNDCRRVLEQVRHEDSMFDPSARDEDVIRHGSLLDRIVALRDWRGPADTEPLRTYLLARDLVNDRKDVPPSIWAKLAREPWRAHGEYLRAADRFHDSSAAALPRFQRLARRYPRHPLASYMVGRCILGGYFVREAEQWELTAGQDDKVKRLYTGHDAERLRIAAAAYDACAVGGGPLARDALGMAGACLYRTGDSAGALLRYCRQLARAALGESDVPAWLSARACLRRMTAADHQRFQDEAAGDPAAGPYLDLHLQYGPAGPQALHSLGLFALRVLERRPSLAVSGAMLGRLAAIELTGGRADRAERLAREALRRCPAGPYRDQARWQRALALKGLNRGDEAMAEFEALAEGAATPKMRRGAHEAAAVLAERLGDLPNAIRHYFALEYRLDYAYLIDCLATTRDLERFLRSYPRHPRARLVRYSLGFRLLRTGQYARAIGTFTPLGPWLETAERSFPVQTSKEAPRMPPLQLAAFLLDCERREHFARTLEEKARWAYTAARLIFRQRHLAFYNGALWKGQRTWAFDLQGGPHPPEPDRDLSPDDERRLDAYQHEHAALVQARDRFLKIADRYPQSPEAPQALYSAALCCTFLPSLEGHWRDSETRLQGQAIALYRRLQRDYPHDPLAAAAAKWGGPLRASRGGVP